MAIIQSALLSKGRGSAGSVTFRRLNGKTVVSEKPLTVANPDTFAQRRGRMLFMLGANEGWALNPYFAARPKLATVRSSTGVSARGSKLLPLQAYIKQAVKTLKEDSGVRGQVSSMAEAVPSKEFDYAAKRSVVYDNSSPVFQALEDLNSTGLPRENAEIAITNISVSQGQVQVPVSVVSGSGVVAVKATIYLIVVVMSGGSVNRYMITRTVEQDVQAGQPTNIQASITIPQGQSIHRAIVEVVPVMDVNLGEETELEPNYALTIGDDVLINGLSS